MWIVLMCSFLFGIYIAMITTDRYFPEIEQKINLCKLQYKPRYYLAKIASAVIPTVVIVNTVTLQTLEYQVTTSNPIIPAVTGALIGISTDLMSKSSEFFALKLLSNNFKSS